MVDEEVVTRFIVEGFEGVEVVAAEGARFFFYDGERKMPFVTVLTKDDYDTVSELSREGVFRVNVGVGRERYEEMFGAAPTGAIGAAVFDRKYDFRVLDELLPHPVYGQMFWVCVLNPGEKSWGRVKELIGEAYGLAVLRRKKRE